MEGTSERGLSPLQAFEAVMGFARRRGEFALQLALHAAVPQVVHADLLQLLRMNFVADARHPGAVETDVMFAPFCTDMGNGYFRFDDNARLQLLQQLDPGHNERQLPRSLQVADFMLAYFERERAGERSDTDPLYRSWLEIERWNALAFCDPEATAEQLAAAVQHACAPDQTSARLRVGTLAVSLATPLVRHHRLLRYAAGVEALHTGVGDAQALLRAVGDAPLEVGSVSLPAASGLLRDAGQSQPALEPVAPPPAVSSTAMEEAVDAAEPPRAPPPGLVAEPLTPEPQPQQSVAAAAKLPGHPLPALRDCEFTAFISYAHPDNEAWFDWVSQFRNELERGLGAMLRGMRLPRFHLSGESGPVPGVLSQELRNRLQSSFALIIVVHDQYAQSDWCLQELAYFKSLYGDEGLRQRLYVVAMSESAMLSITASNPWRSLIAGDEQVWMPFFDPADKNRPLDIYLGPGLVAPAFRMPFERLRSDLAAKLRRSASAGPATRSGPASPATPPAAAPTKAAAGVLLGFTAPASASAVSGVATLLMGRGINARVLSQETVFSDFTEMLDAEHLVLPFDDTPLLMAALVPGGHLALQRDAWLKKGKPAACLHWLDLRSAPPPQPWQGAAAYVQQQGAAVLSIEALLERLSARPAAAPAAAADVVRIYIESNRHERTLWEPMGELLRQRWDSLMQELAPGVVPLPRLRSRGLPMDEIDLFPSLDDADGVVLLWGRKTSEALVAQINKVEKKLSQGREAAPGIVAYLMPPQQATEQVPAWGWQVLRFDVRDEDRIAVVEEERDELDRFLRKVFQCHRARLRAPLS